MILLLPFLLLAVVELGLRVASYGYDTSFFKVERDATGKKFLIDNSEFSYRFFPPNLARWPGTFKLAADKPGDVQRIFIFGESAAMGDPQPSVGASRYLEILLSEKFPGQKFEIVNLGITAINSHVILPIAREVVARGQGDVWLIYMGNNEMVGPFGAATIFGSQAPPLSVARLNLAIQKTKLGQLAVAMQRRLGRKPANAGWSGMRMFLKNQIPPDDARRDTVYKNFSQNLRDIVLTGRRGGAKVLLSSMSVNLKDCPPFASMLNNQLSASDRAQFDALYADGVTLQTNQQPVLAAQKFAQAARLDPKFAMLQFRWAECLLAQTNLSAAQEHFQLACDVDVLPFRANTPINAAIRSLAVELAGTNFAFCDAEAALASATPEGIAGDDSFFEHVHFNFNGNYRLAKAWAEQIMHLMPGELQRKAHPEWASQDTCERAIGLSDWNRGFVISSVASRMELPPLAGQLNNPQRLLVLQHAMSLLNQRQLQTNILAQTHLDFAAAVRSRPADAFLHENYANFLEAIGDLTNALVEYQKIVDLLPHDFYGSLQAGRLCSQLGRLSEAKALLERACLARPSLPDSWFELGLVHGTEADYAAALACFQRASLTRPENGNYLANQAKVLVKMNRQREAIATYRDAIKLDAGNWTWHFELAAELVAVNEIEGAVQAYTAVTQINPQHVVGHINLGVVLARQNRLDEAIQQFEFALRLDPGNAPARDYLQQVSARRNQRR